MSYVSSTDEQTSLSGFGCGPECRCSPCRSGYGGLSEWYEKEEDDEPEPESPPSPKTASPPASQSQSGAALSGWHRPGLGLGVYAPGRFGYFSQAPAAAPVMVYPQINAQLPASGPGFNTYYALDSRGRLDDPPGYHRYAIPEVVRAVQSFAAQWQRLHPQGPRLGIGDLSLLGGGPTPRHGAHQRGLEVDIRPPRNDGRELPATFRDPNYSRSLTQELVNVIRSNPVLRVRVILFNDPEVRGVTAYPGHDNHLHVGFLPPGLAPASPTNGGRSLPTGRPRSSSAARSARRGGPSDIVSRTNQIFYARHPERAGRPIRAGETQLTAEWVAIRNSLLRGS